MLSFFRRRIRHALIAVIIWMGLEATMTWENLQSGGALSRFQVALEDTVVASEKMAGPDPRLVYIGIDSASFSVSQLDLDTLFAGIDPNSVEARALKLMAADWPWSREVHAMLADRLIGAGARAVVFDLLFSRDGRGDDALRSAVERHSGKVFLAANFISENTGQTTTLQTITLPVAGILPRPEPEHPNVGFVNFWPDADGVVRAAVYRTSLERMSGLTSSTAPADIVSMAWRAASTLENVALPNTEQAHLLRWSGPPGTYAPISYAQVFMPLYWERNLQSGAVFKDKVVMVGPSGNWAHDEHRTILGQMPGPELHLNAINALLHHAFLTKWPEWTAHLLTGLAVFAAWLLAISIRKIWLRVALFTVFLAGLILATKIMCAMLSILVPSAIPGIAFFLVGLSTFIHDYSSEILERLRLRRTLEAYVSEEVVRELIDNPESYLNSLGGKRVSVVLLMTDLRGFTTFSETFDCALVVARLNEYFALMVEDIFSSRGSVVNFVGDAILAVWGHLNGQGPVADAKNAVQAAIKMRDTLRVLNQKSEKSGVPLLTMGCGLNFGDVIFGNIGSPRKMEPAVIGDPVNVCSRIEGLTKFYGRNLLLGQPVAELVSSEFPLQFVDRVLMKGKTLPMDIYYLIDPDESTQPWHATYLTKYEAARRAYVDRRFAEALVGFRECQTLWSSDKLSAIYIERCLAFCDQPPAPDWAAVYVAVSK